MGDFKTVQKVLGPGRTLFRLDFELTGCLNRWAV